MSNHPATVREFFARENARTICKGFTPHVWQKEGQMSVAITETFELTGGQLPSDEVLTYAPAIYQECVPKEYDIRMVLMGNHIYSYALKNKKQALDWRQDAGLGHVTADLVPTPPDVEKGVLEFALAFQLPLLPILYEDSVRAEQELASTSVLVPAKP